VSAEGAAPAAGGGRLPLGRELLHRLESFLFWALIQLVGRSCRVRVVAGEEHAERLRREGGTAVLALWHDRLVLGSYFVSRHLIRRGYPVTALVSPSRDGELAARTSMRLGARVVRGSSSRGAREGVRRLLREAAAGRGLVVIPDGPKGPRRVAKPGAVTVARLARAPVVAIGWAADRSWRLGSWDRLEIPKPFARVAVAVGAPIAVPREAGDEALARQTAALEAAFAALEEQATAALARKR
jgi:lysophospholipid acyltransferase (LPLAT)-like uncharacterized protein